MSKMMRATAVGLGLGLLAGCSGNGETKLSAPVEYKHEHDQKLTSAQIAGKLACKVSEDQRAFTWFIPNNTTPEQFIKKLTGTGFETGVIEGPVECTTPVSMAMIEAGLPAVVTGEVPNFDGLPPVRVNQICGVVGMLIPEKPGQDPAPSTRVYAVCPNLSKELLNDGTI